MSRLHLSLLSALLLCCVFDSSFLTIDALVVGLGACRSDQIQALLEFKNEFDSRGCNHSDFVNGVWCNKATGLVKELQLPRGCLRGTLKSNSSLFRLHHLRYLDLSDNDFASSSIPSELGNLNKLEVLYLSSNGFISQVPSSFSNLSQLSILDLYWNELTGSFPLVGNLSKLSTLMLANNHFSGAIPSSLFTMPLLSNLGLNENRFNSLTQVPNSSFSSRLKNLLLGSNPFDGRILEPISKLINLKHLDLSSLNISYPIDLRVFSSLKYLSHLDLFDNSISPASLSSDSDLPLSLETLFISGCKIREFPKVLNTLHNLKHLDISSNIIKGKVPEWLWSLPRLNLVGLTDNLFSGFEGSEEVLMNSAVQILDLGMNRFKGAIPVLPLSIQVFSTQHNNFTGNIPLSICKRSSLTVIDLSYNNFTGSIPQCLSNFAVVILRKNNLKGMIPDMFYAGALHTLDVGYNRLTGKLPRSLLNCSSLKFLSVENNRIKDTFPFWLKTSPALQVLSIRSNRFYGHISPPDQGALGFPELRILEISDNNFTGNLSASYFVNWKAPSLTINEFGRLYLVDYRNDIYIDEDIVDLRYKGLHMEQERVFTSYTAIDFSGNRIEGQIPESIGQVKTLIALNLSNNAFTGHIPLSLANAKVLESLDLSRNQLSGSIPNGLGALSTLAYINVSHNQLKGEIPQGPQIIGQQKSSFESNAGLCGLPLEQNCFDTSAPPVQQHMQEKKEEDEEVLNWKAVVIGYALGVLLGLAIGQVIAS